MEGNNKPVSQEELMLAIQMYDFYLADLNLFLDTHPNNATALAKFNEVKKKRDIAYKAYTEKYGPITAVQTNSNSHFSWVDGPWPWERSAN